MTSLFALLAGCAPQTELAATYAELQRDLGAAHSRPNCAPTDLARADANYVFAQVEFKEGDAKRAMEHVLIARQHAAVSAACTSALMVVAVGTPEDLDGDGLANKLDACPKEAEDQDGYLDSDGCPELDNDGDTIADASDGCADVAEDFDAFQDQDGCPEEDNDGDTVVDNLDACPNSKGNPFDRGCPSNDLDRDGVTDEFDMCPAQFETYNEYQDDDGCPDTAGKLVKVTDKAFEIGERVNFGTGNATILPDSFAVLDQVAQAFKDFPDISVEIQGHTDNVGDEGRNLRLSKARADAVFAYMVEREVEPSRLRAVGYGESAPLDTNETEEGRQNNRRVAFVIVQASTLELVPPTPTP